MGAVERDLREGSCFPSFRASRKEIESLEVTRFQGLPWAHLWRGGGHLALGCACVGVRARVLKPCVRGPCVYVCSARACVPHVHGRGGGRATRPRQCVPVALRARPPERSIASGQECACVG